MVVVLLLGSHLEIAGHPTIPLPWKLLDRWLLRDVLPVRLSVFMFLIVGVIAALWLAQPRGGARGAAKWLAAAAAIAFTVPNIGSGLWHWALPQTRLSSLLTITGPSSGAVRPYSWCLSAPTD